MPSVYHILVHLIFYLPKDFIISSIHTNPHPHKSFYSENPISFRQIKTISKEHCEHEMDTKCLINKHILCVCMLFYPNKFYSIPYCSISQSNKEEEEEEK